ncbi:MAG: ATP-binding cassette domain-containing protein [Mesorhizobium sp.]|uniref:ABC transporter ATP-binding protein n=1 Tax=Mesorhizobium sp. TaxID=1871066 RepID=UPI000FE8B602|nr:oligopeptide/dipeptide ABC transporter ATP-binding protein [Mesorhizobium sp.]RWI63669.1 MAG: ATP-binding cassette domain-containing protein [Mesorhizobium sp.]RWJ42707.1 MAG: ATP-binding cassette domain-containing protein [Mesorhizobium sp.]RWJ58112.1 MAG: ATP-binding cassette domain-containing protein [Mesorhizobium sp.]RWJ63984.1 MAG: ATP-binding cassette domain-containing protein [Mesorhizobium sp.]RWJ93875.1 MAG: ATP-binding cassette domain-containing protein [Mesorhizobium sp.]
MNAHVGHPRTAEQDAVPTPLGESSLLEVDDLRVHLPLRRRFPFSAKQSIKAVDGISLAIAPGEIVGLIGESGSGKTTFGRALLRLVTPSSGRIGFNGTDLTSLTPAEMRAFRRHMQMVFQDPYSSLNPRMSVGEAVGEPLSIHHPHLSTRARTERVTELLSQVGIAPAHASRNPHAFSGGQRQRIAIARALATEPDFIVADEPVSALDVSVQAQIVNLLLDLKERLGLTVLFISHDLGVISHIADRVVVMYLGKVMEIAPPSTFRNASAHPYTQALVSALPVEHPRLRHARVSLQGEIPSAVHPPSGCVFRTRCPRASAECAQIVPELRQLGAAHWAACIKL